MTPVVLGLAATAMTIAGGLTALRWGRSGWLLMSVAAGVVLGVAIFDLLPEAVAMAGSAGLRSETVGLALGFAFYLVIDRRRSEARGPARSWRDHLTPATFAFHSLFDGLGIGLTFQVDTRAGWLVAAAVLTHDFADGINTVSISQSTPSGYAARIWLAVNSAAPLTGVVLGQWVRVAPTTLAMLLAVLAGAFLHIGACELLPRSHALDPRMRTTGANLVGMIFMAFATGLTR